MTAVESPPFSIPAGFAIARADRIPLRINVLAIHLVFSVLYYYIDGVVALPWRKRCRSGSGRRFL
jgi:hypothetical protein